MPLAKPGSKHLLVVEDDHMMRQAVVRLVGAEGWTAVEAGTVADGSAWLARRQFACALMDLGLPDGDGLELVVQAQATWPAMPVMVLTSARGWTAIEAALRHGARGYLLKEDLAHRLGPALRDVAEGGLPLSAAVARQVVEHTVYRNPIAAGAAQAAPPAAAVPGVLSQREGEVVRMLEAGLSYTAIAAASGISINTVRTHIRTLYEKLHVHNRSSAVRVARGMRMDHPR